MTNITDITREERLVGKYANRNLYEVFIDGNIPSNADINNWVELFKVNGTILTYDPYIALSTSTSKYYSKGNYYATNNAHNYAIVNGNTMMYNGTTPNREYYMLVRYFR